MPQIPEPENAQTLKSVPVDAAELSEVEDPEVLPYKISFVAYNESECEIDGLKRSNAAVALKIVRDIGVRFTDCVSLQKGSVSIDEIKHVVRSGAYKKIYKGLGEDIEVMEIKRVRKDKRDSSNDISLRIFFYTLDQERTFYMIAVRETHYNLDH